MSMPHHSETNPEVLQRFVDQLSGAAKPFFPHGKIDPQDEGELAYAIATDEAKGVIRINFNKSVIWLGLDIQSAENLERELRLRVAELKLLEVSKGAKLAGEKLTR